MEKYIINNDTYAVIPTYYGSKIFNKNGILELNMKPKEIISESCKYYGSSLEGRVVGTKNMVGISYKTPIIISEIYKIIMFPTNALRSDDCCWFNLSTISKYEEKFKNQMLLTFINGKSTEIKLSFGILDRQILRASRLENVFLNRYKI